MNIWDSAPLLGDWESYAIMGTRAVQMVTRPLMFIRAWIMKERKWWRESTTYLTEGWRSKRDRKSASLEGVLKSVEQENKWEGKEGKRDRSRWQRGHGVVESSALNCQKKLTVHAYLKELIMAQAIRVLIFRCWQAIKGHHKGSKSLTGVMTAAGREEGSLLLK